MKTLELRLEAASDKGDAKAMAEAISLRNANEHYMRNTVEH